MLLAPLTTTKYYYLVFYFSEVFPDAEIESEKYLIQVEEKFTMEEQKRSAVQQNHQGRPPGIQKVTVKRHGLSSKQGNQQTVRKACLLVSSMVPCCDITKIFLLISPWLGQHDSYETDLTLSSNEVYL